jgi:PIN domain nuclease of toxin-antitoxin system
VSDALLLDSVTFLWCLTADPALSVQAEEAIRDPGRTVYLSPVSAWEITLKHGLGKLELPEPPGALLLRLRDAMGVEELPLTEAASLQLSKLPALHKDPFDRMLICQAIEHGLTIITPDQMVRSYPIRTLW